MALSKVSKMNGTTMIDQDTLKYPLIMLGNGFFSTFSNADELSRCSSSALKSRVYELASYIDADGRRLEVVEVRKLGYVSPLWGWRLMRGRQVNVNLHFALIDSLSLPQVVAFVAQCLRGSPSGASPDFFSEAVRESNSIGEFFHRLNF